MSWLFTSPNKTIKGSHSIHGKEKAKKKFYVENHFNNQNDQTHPLQERQLERGVIDILGKLERPKWYCGKLRGHLKTYPFELNKEKGDAPIDRF